MHEAFVVTGGDEDEPLARDRLLGGASGGRRAAQPPHRDHRRARSWTRPEAQLRVISNMAVGFDNIDVPAATMRGILVTNTPGVLTDATADLAWAFILAAARRVVEGDRMIREGRFERWGPFLLLGRAVAGATLGIVGMGRIGQSSRPPGLGLGHESAVHESQRPLGFRRGPRGRAVGVPRGAGRLTAGGGYREPPRAADDGRREPPCAADDGRREPPRAADSRHAASHRCA